MNSGERIVEEEKSKAIYRSVSDTELSQEQFNRIPCPNLRTGVRMSLLNPDPDGWVPSGEVRAYLSYIGISKTAKVMDLLVGSGERAARDKRDGYINLTTMGGSTLDHGSSTGALNERVGFSEERLERLKNFAGKDGRLTQKTLGRALNHLHGCPVIRKSLLGTHLLSFEFAGLLDIFGRVDDITNQKYFLLEDVDCLFRHNRFPEGWKPPTTQEYGSFKSFVLYLQMTVQRVIQGWGRVSGHAEPISDRQLALMRQLRNADAIDWDRFVVDAKKVKAEFSRDGETTAG